MLENACEFSCSSKSTLIFPVKPEILNIKDQTLGLSLFALSMQAFDIIFYLDLDILWKNPFIIS